MKAWAPVIRRFGHFVMLHTMFWHVIWFLPVRDGHEQLKFQNPAFSTLQCGLGYRVSILSSSLGGSVVFPR